MLLLIIVLVLSQIMPQEVEQVASLHRELPPHTILQYIKEVILEPHVMGLLVPHQVRSKTPQIQETIIQLGQLVTPKTAMLLEKKARQEQQTLLNRKQHHPQH